MEQELRALNVRLKEAKVPEDVFGKLSGTAAEKLKTAKTAFRGMLRITYVDHWSGTLRTLAEETFKNLDRFWNEVQAKIAAGTYGKKAVVTEVPLPRAKPVVIQVKKSMYTIGSAIVATDFYDLFRCLIRDAKGERDGVFKIAREAQDADLALNEVRILKLLHEDKRAGDFVKYIPDVDASFVLKNKAGRKQVTVFPWTDGFYSLGEVIKQYPGGIDPRDMAWIWRRLLDVLGFAHANGIVHGAVLPENILICPRNHGGVLIEWSFAVLNPAETGEKIRAISSEYEAWYPSEILTKGNPTPATDIYMSALCMIKLLGGDPVKGIIPNTVPQDIAGLLRWCAFPAQHRRPDNAWSLNDTFDEILRKLYGKRKFREFYMPTRSVEVGAA